MRYLHFYLAAVSFHVSNIYPQSSQTPATPSKRMRMNSESGSASPKPTTSGASEEEFDPDVIQKMLIQIKCLNICRNMLERSEEVKQTMQ
jgi:hypothetical protein